MTILKNKLVCMALAVIVLTLLVALFIVPHPLFDRNNRELLEQQAEAGDPDAMYQLARSYRHGWNNFDQDTNKSVQWYERAAALGYTNAWVDLAYIYYKGEHVEKDIAKSLDYTQKAAEAENKHAIANLGYLYLHGQQVDKDELRAFDLLKKAAEQGVERAEYPVAWLYINNEELRDPELAVTWYEKAADHKTALGAQAQYALGHLYYTGEHVAKDLSLAITWFEKSADFGNENARYLLGKIYIEDKNGIPPDPEKAKYWFKSGAELDDPNSQYWYARALMRYPEEKPRDYIEAGRYLAYAREHNHEEAIDTLNFYINECSKTRIGYKVYYNMGSCFVAAHSGDRYVQHAIGLSYFDGRGQQTVDFQKARDWFLKCAQQKYDICQFYLAQLYDQGKGVERDVIEAYAWMGVGLKKETLSPAMAKKARLAKNEMWEEMDAAQRRQAEDKLTLYLEQY